MRGPSAMGWARVSILRVMLAMGYLAVGLAALRSPYAHWIDRLQFLTIAVLVLTSLLARFGPNGRRDYWFGFALFGWAQLVLGFDLEFPWVTSALEWLGIERYYGDGSWLTGAARVLAIAASVPLGGLGGVVAEMIAARASRRDRRGANG